ncbi:1-acyl-sn-glycerol-3-phosphate acyltransferase [Zeaxanthinibacter sp. PT1]|uniref:1-acyl-sn-glycerol-3-phosphate acyltransferase n=1 Tax=Zeaxanthinibacter TaxID=561554 RepID=UPI00234B18AB|nr:1-acyl-sn-glycerol-3-phosphate acyltransferase [Zeaxanthinibacter sp. PT1]MDC6352498.1 1-acyl-sn-glycerol-3-phosphate acyltransferase [Zeaxanthinibacter sp. PT1]
MREFSYALLKKLIRFGFFCYYQEVRMHGLKDLPTDKPMLILPNHQNALIDPLLIAAFAKESPFFLTRADVFSGGLLESFFRFLHMIPIYRLRDGRDSLGRNEAVFEQCTRLLRSGKSIVMFPEANHNLERRVRPLSKGFTRILFGALQENAGQEIYVVPVGINFVRAAGFPDRVAFYFDRPVPTRSYYDPENERTSVIAIRDEVATRLRRLTTHIPEEIYTEIQSVLEDRGVDYTDPVTVNRLISEIAEGKAQVTKKEKRNKITGRLWDGIFVLLNLPVVLLWKIVIKPRVSEPEFLSTTRFLFALLIYPIIYLVLLLFLPLAGSIIIAVLLHFLFNLLYVKFR